MLVLVIERSQSSRYGSLCDTILLAQGFLVARV